eukprot:scaffold4.g4626.t1
MQSLARLGRLLAASPLPAGAAPPPAAAAAALQALLQAWPAAAAGLHTSAAAAAGAAAEAAVAPSSATLTWAPDEAEPRDDQLTPRQVVELLDRYIVGQAAAKKAVANALRNRWRRHRVPSPLREEIVPKNILMIGPTGCGKTEIARRLAKLADAPFVKVEATKFTEVGFHGRDVDQIVRDLVDNAIVMMRARMRREHKAAIDAAVEERLLAQLLGPTAGEEVRRSFRKLYREGALEDRQVEVEVAQPRTVPLGENFPVMSRATDQLGKARRLLWGSVDAERAWAAGDKGPVSYDQFERMVRNALCSPARPRRRRAFQPRRRRAVHLQLLLSPPPRFPPPGSVVSTKYGNVNTDHILFICSGAFHSCKPSDMLAELQGRLPIRVELSGLTQDDFYRILTEPENNMIRQQQALLATEDVDIHFTDAAIREVARVAEEVNTNVDNIGARRLHTILERILEDAREAGGRFGIVIDKEQISDKLTDLLKKQDLSRYVLSQSHIETGCWRVDRAMGSAGALLAVLYRGRGMRLFRVLVRLKVFQLSGVAALAAVVAAALVAGSGAASTALWFYSRRYVGELALLRARPASGGGAGAGGAGDAGGGSGIGGAGGGAADPSALRVRLSVLDFWGNREDNDVALDRLVPPLAGLPPGARGAAAAEPLMPLDVEGDRQYYLSAVCRPLLFYSLRYGRMADAAVLQQLLAGELPEQRQLRGAADAAAAAALAGAASRGLGSTASAG